MAKATGSQCWACSHRHCLGMPLTYWDQEETELQPACCFKAGDQAVHSYPPIQVNCCISFTWRVQFVSISGVIHTKSHCQGSTFNPLLFAVWYRTAHLTLPVASMGLLISVGPSGVKNSCLVSSFVLLKRHNLVLISVSKVWFGLSNEPEFITNQAFGWYPPSLLPGQSLTLPRTSDLPPLDTSSRWAGSHPEPPSFSISRWKASCHTLLSLLQSSNKSKPLAIVSLTTNFSKACICFPSHLSKRHQWAPREGRMWPQHWCKCRCASQPLLPLIASHLHSGCRGKTDWSLWPCQAQSGRKANPGSNCNYW